MKKLMTFAVLVSLVAFSSMAFAQAEPNDIAVTFDLAGTVTTADPAPFTTTNLFYVVGFDHDNAEVSGFEFELLVDPVILTFGVPVILPPGSPINVGDGANELIVGLGNCAPGGGATALAQWTYGVFTPGAADLTICLIASSPSSFNPAVPGYLRCDGGLVPYGLGAQSATYGDGCAVVYATGEAPVATTMESFGAVKGRF